MKEKILAVISALNRIPVVGEQQCDLMLGSIQTLKAVVSELEEGNDG